MSLALAPFGMIPIRVRGGLRNTGALNRYRINPAGLAVALTAGDPITLGTNGFISRVSTSADYCIGVFGGCLYNDPTTKRPTWTLSYAANTSVGTDPQGIQAFIIDNPYMTFRIQADASVSVGDVGYNFCFNASTGNQTINRSTYALQASSRTASAILALRLVDIYDTPDNAFSDPFPVVGVQWVQHRDFRASAG